MKGRRIGFALTGSYCTFAAVMPEIARLRDSGAEIVPIMSETAASTDTRFGRAEMWRGHVLAASGALEIIDTIALAEPIGPGKLLDLVIVAPCTGNTLAKIAGGITDSSVTMAVKAHLRNLRPVLVAISTNDGLGLNAVNLARLQSSKNIFMEVQDGNYCTEIWRHLRGYIRHARAGARQGARLSIARASRRSRGVGYGAPW